ncbi:MAG TPA: flagellar motor protein [Gaiellaceae bacterium]|nr:flagellar motor protein [Gaiellaceae bacterium]
MKATTAIGIAGAFVLLLLSVLMDGGNPMSFLNIPALLIVIGGTSGATIASTQFPLAKKAAGAVKIAVRGDTPDLGESVERMVSLAEKARRDGLLALEDDLANLDDAFARKGVQLVVDGADSELVQGVLNSEIDGMAERHGSVARVFTTAGGFAPTLGILGTVMSLVHVLENLDSPSSLGHSIAGAFIATLYGVGSANLVFLPIANKLKELSGDELANRELLVSAILSIQAGDNPRLLREKLEAFLAPGERDRPRTAAAADGAAPAAEPEPAAV